MRKKHIYLFNIKKYEVNPFRSVYGNGIIEYACLNCGMNIKFDKRYFAFYPYPKPYNFTNQYCYEDTK